MAARRWPLVIIMACAICGVLAPARPGRADDDSKKTCASAFSGAQRLMRGGRLLEARKMLLLCGGPQCPAVMHPDCQQWLASVEASTPTVVFQVSAGKGELSGDVAITVDDGESMPLDGRALSMDPGAHEVTFVADGFVTTHRRIVVSEGEKLHRESVEMLPVPAAVATDARPAPGPAETERGVRRSRLTAPVLVASGAALAAGALAVYLGLKARSDDRGLGQCSPSCTRDRVDQVKSEYLWTNVSIGLAVAGLATATVLVLVHGDPAQPRGKLAFAIDVKANALAPTVTGKF